ncbi:DUF2267 domain-containing protein [Amycolatopsis thermoflava]|uniref:DUF2267 domain-containing protein n=1 Tax=Amycolatopsis thermoflava TaxID=84480 RepID=UPI0038189606
MNDPLAHAEHSARTWLAAVAERLGTEDRRFAHRATRAWLHTVRDRLTVDSAAHLAAQLPEFLRGTFYEGWVPSRVPVRYGPAEFTTRFAREAGVGEDEVPGVAGEVTGALSALLSPGELDHVFALMPPALRGELDGSVREADRRIAALEARVDALTEAVAALVRGLEEVPADEPEPGRGARAAQEAHRILITQAATHG